MNLIDSMTCALVASGKWPEKIKSTKAAIKWAFKEAKLVIQLRCESIGHTDFGWYDSVVGKDYWKCSYCGRKILQERS